MYKEILIYSIVAVSSLTMLAYSVHMFVGGLVAEETEYMLMACVVGIGIIAIGLMAWDVVKRRRSSNG